MSFRVHLRKIGGWIQTWVKLEVQRGYTAFLPLDRHCECPQCVVAGHVYNSLATIITTRAAGKETPTRVT
jgi:hypothetical protein